MKIYRYKSGLLIEENEVFRFASGVSIDALFLSKNPQAFAKEAFAGGTAMSLDWNAVTKPLDNQEIWASGVTYLRSRSARMEESKDAGGGDFYERVYRSDRPEVFFKATPNRAVGHGENVVIRADSGWDVPEPELTLAISQSGRIFGYTVGNDMSSRAIEGENPLYLPQAKTYRGCAAIGPCILVQEEALGKETSIELSIERCGEIVYSGTTDIGQITRSFESLKDYLFRDNAFPSGVYLMTGTGIIPEDHFTLQSADRISIKIEPIGTLLNIVE